MGWAVRHAPDPFISWRRWPGRTVGSRGPGTSSTESRRRAGWRRSGSGCRRPHQRIAPRRGGLRVPRRSRHRLGWSEAPHVTSRREVCTATAAAVPEHEFFKRLRRDGMLVHPARRDEDPGEITGVLGRAGMPCERRGEVSGTAAASLPRT